MHQATWPLIAKTWVCIAVLGLTACTPKPSMDPDPELSITRISSLIERSSANGKTAKEWASDVHKVLVKLDKKPNKEHVCAVIVVTEQISNFQADPKVQGLPRMVLQRFDELDNVILKKAIDLRLDINLGKGPSFAEQLAQVQTEQDLEDWYNGFTASMITGPLLKVLDKDIDSLISTIGSMQVSADFARDFAKLNGISHTHIRKDLYQRYWGLYYGSAHLLAYEHDYSSWEFVFADYNAGQYTSRNAGFQHMVRNLSGAQLSLDGDLLGAGLAGSSLTHKAVEKALQNNKVEMDGSQIHADLSSFRQAKFGQSKTYKAIASIYEKKFKTVVKEKMPQIELNSQKLSRNLTTAWFAQRVMSRFEQCNRLKV